MVKDHNYNQNHAIIFFETWNGDYNEILQKHQHNPKHAQNYLQVINDETKSNFQVLVICFVIGLYIFTHRFMQIETDFIAKLFFIYILHA